MSEIERIGQQARQAGERDIHWKPQARLVPEAVPFAQSEAPGLELENVHLAGECLQSSNVDLRDQLELRTFATCEERCRVLDRYARTVLYADLVPRRCASARPL